MAMRIFVCFIILIAILVGILALALPREDIIKLIIFRDFFEVAIPILAFGALVKYLYTPCHRHHHCHDKECPVCMKK